MKLSLSDESQANIITAYAQGNFTVRGQVFSGSHIFWPEKAPLAWELADIADLNQQSFNQLLCEDTEAIILGTGKSLLFPDDKWLEQIYSHSIGIEIMDTPAACRTYNILVSEGRQIVAALIAI